jgi:murein DD-endopeptidase MepM/ murein hydrolase activator NlpD
MRGRAGAVVLVVGLFAAGLAAGAIKARPFPATTTSDTTATTATAATTTTSTASTVATTTAASTDVATTTASTSVATTTVTTTAAPAVKTLTAVRPPAGCVFASGFALLDPGRAQLALGRVADAREHSVSEAAVAYPADQSILSASSVDLQAGGCAGGRADVREVSLFGGAVTARRVRLKARGDVTRATVEVEGLAIGGRGMASHLGRTLAVGDWGSLVARAVADGDEATGLALHLNKQHAGVAAGTTVYVGVVHVAAAVSQQAPQPHVATKSTHARGAPAVAGRAKAKLRKAQRPKAKKPERAQRRKRLGDDPLKLTPPLGFSATHYVFPVAGESSYIDTYGAYRGDVPGNWHHGDDIFAALGTPVVAVADGTLNRVGWERLGGWRLWVRDQKRNEFYYAHLSGYSPLAMRSKHVKAGDVIGFIGNTGDAFTTSPHLHFEIHPHQLLGLDYNGAVDPTGYLDEWRQVKRVRAPLPVHPRFPLGAVRAEASYVWRQLLAARGLTAHAPSVQERPHIAVPGADHLVARGRHVAAAAVRAGDTNRFRLLDGLLVIGLPALLFGAALFLRLRREPQAVSATRSSASSGLAGRPLIRKMRTLFLPARKDVSEASSEKRSLPPEP